MDCRDVRRALPALLDGDLPPARAEAVREHLAGCPRCRRAYEAYRQDQQVLTQFLRTAPWLPVAAEVREQVRGRRGFWHALATGGNRLAAAGALVALLALVAASGFVLHTMVQRGGSPQPALGNTPTVAAATGPCGTGASGAPAGFQSGSERASYDRAVQELSAAGLAFDICQTIEVGGRKVTFLRLVADRTWTYLDYVADGGPLPSDQISLLANGQLVQPAGPGEALAGAAAGGTATAQARTWGWNVFPGLDTSASRVTVQVTSSAGDTQYVGVPVNLARLRDLPESPSVAVATAASSVRLSVGQLVRGVAVSSVTLLASGPEPGAVERLGEGGQQPPVTATVDGKAVPVIGTRAGAAAGSLGLEVQLLDLPTSGTLQLTVESAQVRQGGTTQTIHGPWTLSLDLANPGRVAQTTPSASPTTTPTPTVTASPSPAPSPSPAATALPSDLYFLAQTDDGSTAIWVQPADGGKPRALVRDKQSIVSFQVFANAQRIAYVTAAGDAVHLATLDGRPLGPAKMPGGAEVAEYVPSPDGSQIAYVPLDRHSVVIAASDGSGSRTAYQVPQPEADSVIGLSWSPDGSKVVFRHARIESGEKPVVMPAEKGASKKPLWEGSRDALDLAWSPDGSRLVYTDGGRIFRVDLATGAEKELTPGPLKGSGQALVDLAWLPADRVAFAAHADGSVYSPATLWLMQSDGTQAWRAIPDLGEALTMRWAPGGKDVVLAVWTPDGLQYYPDIHEAPVTLFAGTSGESHPVVTWERGLTTH